MPDNTEESQNNPDSGTVYLDFCRGGSEFVVMPPSGGEWQDIGHEDQARKQVGDEVSK
jgi:hypothetical protein